MRSALALVAAAGTALGLEVHERCSDRTSTDVYPETPADFSPRGYRINGLVAVVEACPCDWTRTEIDSGSYEGLILAVPDDACTECAATLAACFGKLANASGMLLPDGFGEGVSDSATLSASCEEEPLPTAFISRNATADLVDVGRERGSGGGVCSGGGAINVTMADPDDQDLFDCDALEYVPLIYLGFVPVWLAAAVLWAWNNLRHTEHARELHRRLAFLPLIGLVQAGLSVIFYAHCPWKTSPFIVALTLCWVLASIVKEPVVILSFVLVAKGWGVTRDDLSRCDTWRIGACIVAMFVSMAVQMAVETPFAVLATVGLYVIILLEVSFSIKTNLLVLKAQLCALRQFSIDPRSTPAYHKYNMFRRLTWLATGYVACEMALHLSFEFTDRYNKTWWPFILAHQASELLFAVCIGYSFRATPLNVLFQRVQAQVAELAERLLPQITTVEIGPELLAEGSDLVAWRQDMQLASAAPAGGSAAATMAEPPPTLLVVNPGDASFGAMPPGQHQVELQPTPGWSASPMVAGGASKM